jgi:hypothetical protein
LQARQLEPLLLSLLLSLLHVLRHAQLAGLPKNWVSSPP